MLHATDWVGGAAFVAGLLAAFWPYAAPVPPARPLLWHLGGIGLAIAAIFFLALS